MLFPLPELKDPYEGIAFPDQEVKDHFDQSVRENKETLENYQKNVQAAYFELWKVCAGGFLTLQTLLNFFFMLISHVDATTLEDIRKRLVGLFTPDFRAHLRGVSLHS